ncbi:hypothetical protein [Clostridium vincentii]|uniref:DNA polymerase IV n=1 Tax=Clostridium vincentii TaxID=52704 RepID=A0A2T0B543_9CLOT|nr:hypothetical protein [Clostridium vincentii]PRR79005.1 DNA polymerase IV [Clostridium vincentii]
MGVYITGLCSNEFYQYDLFDDTNIEKAQAIDKIIDDIRSRYGSNSILRSSFLHSGIKAMSGGIGEEDYPVMTSLL